MSVGNVYSQPYPAEMNLAVLPTLLLFLPGQTRRFPRLLQHQCPNLLVRRSFLFAHWKSLSHRFPIPSTGDPCDFADLTHQCNCIDAAAKILVAQGRSCSCVLSE